MTQAQLEALLGRSLTTVEVTNLDLYLEIAYGQLEELICSPVRCKTEEREFDVREGYSTVWTGIFSEVYGVTASDTEIEYSKRRFDARNGKWFNSLVLDTCADTVVVNAVWGFKTMPADLKLVLAGLFNLVGKSGSGNVKSKRVEDFYITFNDNTDFDQLLLDNSVTLSKYSLCGIGEISHGGPGSYGYWERFGERHYGLL